MKQFIKDNRPYSQTAREDLIQHFLSIGCVEVPVLYNGNFIDAIWNGTAFVEGATQEQLEAEDNQTIALYKAEIYTMVENLYKSAKERSLGKQNQNLTEKQLEILEKNYLNKEIIANQILADEVVTDVYTKETIEFEMANDFVAGQVSQTLQYINSTYGFSFPTSGVSDLKLYCYLISAKSMLGKQLDSYFNSLIEMFRSKLITFLDKKQFDKIEKGKELVAEINSETDVAGIQLIVTKFKAL